MGVLQNEEEGRLDFGDVIGLLICLTWMVVGVALTAICWFWVSPQITNTIGVIFVAVLIGFVGWWWMTDLKKFLRLGQKIK